MTDEEFWAVEAGLWTLGRSHYERWFSANCVAGFPKPIAIMHGNAFVADLPETGGFEAVEMEERTLVRTREDVVVLGYVGTGIREGNARASVCTSTYAQVDGAWTLIQHQQTPVMNDV